MTEADPIEEEQQADVPQERQRLFAGYSLSGYRDALARVLIEGPSKTLPGAAGLPSEKNSYADRHEAPVAGQLIDGVVVESQFRSHVEFSLSDEDLLGGRYYRMMEQSLEQVGRLRVEMQRNLLRFASDVCEASGQISDGTSVRNEPIEMLLFFLDRMQISFTADGVPDLSTIVFARDNEGGPEYFSTAPFLNELDVNGTDEQKQRLYDIIERQREEWSEGQRYL